MRIALHASELAKHHHEPSTLIIDELGLDYGSTRIDIAIVNGSIHGYEIKSARDSLVRLPSQARIYNSCLDFVTLVTAEKHLARAIEIIPPWWSVKIAQETTTGISFTSVRAGYQNPSLKPEALCSLLWKNEVLGILEELNADKGYRSKRLPVLVDRLVELTTVEQLSEYVRSALKRRLRWRPDAIRT